MNKIKIHLKDFPDNIAIRLNNKFRDKLFKDILKNFNQKELSKLLKINQGTMISWKKGRNFIPLSKLRLIINILNNKNITLSKIEKNVIEYRTQHGELNSIKNPIIPIKDSPELREIVLHFMGDGCVIKYAAYYNNDLKTKDEFVKELKKVFGDVGYKIYSDHVHFSMSIPHILSHYFKVSFKGNECRIPNSFFEGNKKELSSILRAIIIDEGTVDGSNVRIDSNNKLFLEDIKRIASEKLKYNCGKIWESKGPIFRFNILSKNIQDLYENIKPLPIDKKEYLLKLACKTVNKIWKYSVPGVTKIKIIKELMKKNQDSVELSYSLGIQRTSLNKHWKWLIDKKLVKVVGKSTYSLIYSINDINKANKFLSNPSFLIKDKKIDNYGITQLKILKLLKNNPLQASKINKKIGIGIPSTLKTLKSLIKKRFISKRDKTYFLTKKGKKIINMNKKTARIVLYSNVKDLDNFNKTDLNLIAGV